MTLLLEFSYYHNKLLVTYRVCVPNLERSLKDIMFKLKKPQVIFGIIIVLVVAFIGGIELRHYQQIQRANEIQRAIDKQTNAHITRDRVGVSVPDPKHINILLKGGTGEQIGDVLSTGKPLKKFDFWQELKNKVNETDDSVRKQFGKGITVSLMDPNNPTKAIYSVRDGKVVFDKGATVTNVN